MAHKASLIDKGKLYNKIVYIYFCFYGMAVAERYSISILYGAALYISLSALARSLEFIARTAFDARWLKVFKWALAVFFMLSTVYVLVLYPLHYQSRNYTAAAVAIILLPFFERSAENFLLRRKKGPLSRRAIALNILPLEIGLIVLTGALVFASGLRSFEFMIAAALGMGLGFVRQWTFRDYASEYPKAVLPQDDTRQIRSARLYDGMMITSGVALHLFAFTYVLYIIFSRKIAFFHNFFIVFAVITVVFGTVLLLAQRFLLTALVQRIGKNAAFVFGTGIAIFAAYMLRGSWFLGGIAISAQAVLLLVGLSLQMTAALGLGEDILLVIKLYRKDVDEAALSQRAQRLEHWTALISEAVFLIVLGVLIFDPLVTGSWLDDYIELAPHIGSSVVAVPTVFLLIALIYSIKQPLTQKYARRLKAYARIREEGKSNPEMEKRLQNVLIRKYKKRIGVHIIRAFLKPILYHTVTGQENVDALPGIFVFNHREVYGPIAAVVFLPYDIRPWVLNKMLDKEEIRQHMYDGTFSRFRWLPVCLRRLLTSMISPLVIWALSSLEPIPVFRGTAKSVIKTFELSIECLQSGDSILLFPENPAERYTQNEVNDFYRGFAHIGRLYYKRTRESVTFYPVFASRFARMLRIGQGVAYDPSNGRKEEGRIVKTLELRMRELQQLDEE